MATVFATILWSCGIRTQKNVSTENDWNYRLVDRKHIDSLMVNICESQDLEFFDLYPIMDSIASDKYERLILVESLKTYGFTVTDWARGNWTDGPRIVNITMTNRLCECQVDKLYHMTDEEGKYKVTERIKCEKADG